MRKIIMLGAASLALAMLPVFGVPVAQASKASSSASAATEEFESSAAILKWMNGYRERPEPARLPTAIHQLSALGTLRDPDSAGVYVGFLAGVLADNPGRADDILARTLPLPAEDQWLVVRAIAYSGAPHWRELMSRIASRVPARQPMVTKYLGGSLPVLGQYRLDAPKPDFWREIGVKLSLAKAGPKPVVLEPSPELLDTFWGFYFATGRALPVQNIMNLLPLSKNKDDTERLTLGGMAKFTLAQNASRDPALLALLKSLRDNQSKEVRPVLDEVIEAADDVDVSSLRREVLASLDELRRKGPESKRDAMLWGQIGEGAVAAGCITAAVTAQVQFAIPCVVGGAVGSGALNIWSSQK